MISLNKRTLRTLITYTKKEGWHLHKNSTTPLHLFAFNHPNDVFYFQNASEINEIHVLFTIRIQILSQLQSMVSLCDNRVVSMDVTFSTNIMPKGNIHDLIFL
jgi:hypothetical protein